MSVLIKKMQRHVANVSIGPSTARRMGPPGTIRAVQDFLAEEKLGGLGSVEEFSRYLDSATCRLANAFPGTPYWGSARKFLNIFLRNCVYNRYLCEHFRLQALESLLEVPLDKQVASCLIRDSGDNLPRWPGVIKLTKDAHADFQKSAQFIAAQREVARVHLDLWYWRAERETIGTTP